MYSFRQYEFPHILSWSLRGWAGWFRHRIKIEYIGNLWRGSRGFLITSDGFLHLDSIYIPNNMHNASKVPRLLAFSSIRIIKTFSHYWITSTIQCHLKQSRREIRNWLDSSFCLLSIVVKIFYQPDFNFLFRKLQDVCLGWSNSDFMHLDREQVLRPSRH